jgi:hypothetical protein
MRYLSLLAASLLLAAVAQAQTDCPFGLTNDPAPGQCGRYTDTDGNSICDLSQPSPAAEPIPAEETAPPNDNVADTPLREMTQAELDDACQPEGSFEVGTDGESQTMNDSIALVPPSDLAGTGLPNRPNHHPWLLMFLVGILSLSGELWQKREPAKLMLIQSIWNWLLLASFLASSLTGLYFILGTGLKLGPAMHYWHTLSSILFIYIAIYHVIRRAACLLRGPQTCYKGKPCR